MLKEAQVVLTLTTTDNQCPIGETVGNAHIAGAKIPVLSCEGACIRGEIARQAANVLSRHPGFGRACHGELLTVADSAIARWVKAANRVVLIDGCFLRCHGRILENLLGKEQLMQFDALSHYKKYSDLFDPEEVPEAERLAVAGDVAEWVAGSLAEGHGESCLLPGRREKNGCCGSQDSCLGRTAVPSPEPQR